MMNYFRNKVRSKTMNDFLLIGGFLVVWLALQYVILPKLGVGT
jgi:hypothetical protein